MARSQCQLRIGVNTVAISLVIFFGTASLSFGQSNPQSGSRLEPGLAVTFNSPDGSASGDTIVLPSAVLYVPARMPPTPFLPGGRFSAEWIGFVSVELRDNFAFQAELNGDMKLEINGALVLEASARGTNTEPSKPVRLNKGTNAFKLRFTSPPEGDAFLRLLWSSREFPIEPISPAALSHEVSAELRNADRLRQGRELVVEFRCLKCHSGPAGDAIPELAMDAPALDGLGSRRNYDWMSRWILDPKSLRPSAHMPKVLNGASAKEDAGAIAAFLASLKSGEELLSPLKGTNSTGAGVSTVDVSGQISSAEQVESGKGLFEKLHCAACHDTPGTTKVDSQKISLAHVREKFASVGSLVAFLQKPGAHYAWIRMPDFKLNSDEAAQLAGFVISGCDKPDHVAVPSDAAVLERGRQLVQTVGCLNCHSLKLENHFAANALANMPADKWKLGCLAEKPVEASKAPSFGFSAAERDALRAFGATDRASLWRHVPTEFAQRQIRALNCAECHGKIEGVPPLEVLGGKLRPEWSKAFIGGEVATKPRFWLDARMPAFPSRAGALARGLAMLHGYPPETQAEPPIDQEAATVGRRLVAAPPEGFACVQCHGVAKVGATQVFESNGINLAQTARRLLKPYYRRWVRNPLRVDPATKMPVYFDEEGRSPLTEVYGGDGSRQIDAIWQYIRLGDDMPPPPGTQPPP